MVTIQKNIPFEGFLKNKYINEPFLGIRKTYIREPADQTTCFQRPWQFCALLFSNKLLQYFASPIYLSNSQPPICLQYVSNMPPICFHHDQASPCCFGQQCGHAAKAQQLLETDLKTLSHVLELSIPTYQAKPCRTLHSWYLCKSKTIRYDWQLC